MTKSYTFLNSEEKDKSRVLTRNETITPQSFVIRNEYGEYGVCHYHYATYDDWVKSPEYTIKTLHEISLGGPQKLKFDLDATQVDLNECDVSREELFDNVFTSAAEWLASLASISVDEAKSKIAIADSSNDRKFSRHLIITGYYVPDNSYARAFAELVHSHLPEVYRKFIDMQVYKPTQNFRMLDCHKVDNEDRPKRAITNHTKREFMITQVDGCEELTSMGRYKPPRKVATIAPSVHDVATIEKLMAPYADGQRFSGMKGNVAVYRRIKPSMCPICDTVHHNDNTIYGIVTNYNELIARCRHNSQSSILIGDLTPIGDISVPRPPDETIPEIVRPRCPKFESIPANFHLKEVNQKSIEDFCFDNYRCLIVKSGMGTGKTDSLVRYIDTLPSHAHVIIVSMRKTFTQEIMSRLKGFTAYNTKTGKLVENRIVVQFESLHRVQLAGLGDVTLVLDECESIITQMNPANPNNAESLATFQWLLRHSNKVLMMDAAAGERTYKLAGQTGMKVKIIDNSHVRNECNDIHYTEPTGFMRVFCEAAKVADKHPIVVASSSKAMANLFASCGRAQNPKLRIAVYTKDKTPEQVKELECVNKSWLNYDIVIYTPTITAGVSFTQPHFHKFFGWFMNTSCDYITAIQMMGRVRQIDSHEYHIHITKPSMTDYMLPMTAKAVDEALASNADMVINGVKINHNGLEVEIAPNGIDRIYRRTFAYNIHAMNVLHRCQSVAYYPQLFRALREKMGCKVLFAPREAIQPIADAIRNTLKKHKDRNYEIIANAIVNPDTEPIEKDVMTPDERAINDKIKLADDYHVPVEDITKEFVTKYSKNKVRRAFRNGNTFFGHTAKNISEIVSQRLPGLKDAIDDHSALLRGESPRMAVGVALLECIIGKNLTTDMYNAPIEIEKTRIIEGVREAATKLAAYQSFIGLNFKIDISQGTLIPYNVLIQSINKVAFELFGMKFATVRGSGGKAGTKVKLGVDKLFTVGVNPRTDMPALRPIKK